MTKPANNNRLDKLLSNSRFWVLSFGLICSLIIYGLVQQFVPAGTLQTIRLEQTFGFVSLGLLFLALLVTPLTKVFPKLPYKDAYLHSRRAIGVLAFYYAALHSVIAFFKQLQGFTGLKYLGSTYQVSLLAAIVALFILFLMAITSTDWAVRTLTFKNWKRLQRFVYLASILILLHVLLIVTHYINHTIYFYLTLAVVAVLVALEIVRVVKGKINGGKRKNP